MLYVCVIILCVSYDWSKITARSTHNRTSNSREHQSLYISLHIICSMYMCIYGYVVNVNICESNALTHDDTFAYHWHSLTHIVRVVNPHHPSKADSIINITLAKQNLHYVCMYVLNKYILVGYIGYVIRVNIYIWLVCDHFHIVWINKTFAFVMYEMLLYIRKKGRKHLHIYIHKFIQ